MATQTMVHVFSEDLAEKVHNLGSDQLRLELMAAANAPTTSTAQLSDLTPISYTNLSTRNLTTSTSAQSSGAYKLVVQDLVLSASGGSVGPFRYVAVINDTSTNDRVISFFDYGSDVTIPDGGSFTFDADGTNGLIQLAVAA